MLERIVLQGFKSFRELDLALGRINVLIGANGSGKSNFVQIFQMMSRAMNQGLQTYVAKSGGANQLLHYGRRVTEQMHLEFWFDRGDMKANGYAVTLLPTDADTLVLTDETCFFHNRARYNRPYSDLVAMSPHPEAMLPLWAAQERGVPRYVWGAMRSWQVYHFHDTSDVAQVKQTGDLHDNAFLRPDAANLAAYLYLLRETAPECYRAIVETVQMAAPFFGDFVLRPSPFNLDKIRLEWQERGSDVLFGPNVLSDGTLRFICLATLFLQPRERLPATIILDEPELGLHPYAIVLLADMVRAAAVHTQVVLSTQSVTLVNQFTPEEILVVDREQGISTIRRLSADETAHWLERYGLGDLWEKNLIGGRPAR